MSASSPYSHSAAPRHLITVGHLLSILRGHSRTVALVTAIGISLSVAATLLSRTEYTASATVLVDVRSPDPINGVMMQGITSPAYMNTQVDLLNSEAVARRVVRTLRLTEAPDMQAAWRKSNQDDAGGDMESWVAQSIARNLRVTPAKESNLLHVGYVASDPKMAAALANGFVKAFIDTTLDLRTEPAKEYKRYFDANAKQLREQLEVAQRKLSAYQQKHGLTSINSAQVDVETARLNELSSQMVALQADVSESKRRDAQARKSGDQLKEALDSPLLYGLRGDLQRARAKLTELRARLGERHPEVIQLVANIGELNTRISEETRRVSSSVVTNNSVNIERMSDLKASLEEQRQRVMKLKSLNDESQVMQRDVENLQKAYDEVLGRANKMNLESQTGQTNVSMVGSAVAPTKPSSPNLIRNLLSGLLLGGLLGVIVAFVREARDQRLRSDEEITLTMNQPLLVVLPAFGKRSNRTLPLSGNTPRPKRLTAA